MEVQPDLRGTNGQRAIRGQRKGGTSQLDRIDIDGEADFVRQRERLGQARQPLAQRSHMRRSQHDLISVISLRPQQGRRDSDQLRGIAGRPVGLRISNAVEDPRVVQLATGACEGA